MVDVWSFSSYQYTHSDKFTRATLVGVVGAGVTHIFSLLSGEQRLCELDGLRVYVNIL